MVQRLRGAFECECVVTGRDTEGPLNCGPSADAVDGRLLLFRYGPQKDILERRDLLIAQLGVGHGFAGHHLVAHGGVVEEDGLDGGDLCEVGGLQALVGVHVGVVSAALVVHRVLDELEAGEADGVEGEMIGAAGVAHGDGGDAEVSERPDPLAEDRLLGGVALQIDATDLSGAVVDDPESMKMPEFLRKAAGAGLNQRSLASGGRQRLQKRRCP
jgi:hypothetical protein